MGQLQFTGWLKDDKLLATLDETQLAKRLRNFGLRTPAGSGSSGHMRNIASNSANFYNQDYGQHQHSGQMMQVRQMSDQQQQLQSDMQAMYQQPATGPYDNFKYLNTKRGELIIRNVGELAHDHTGTYKCRAKNKLTGEQVVSQVGAKLLQLDGAAGGKSSMHTTTTSGDPPTQIESAAAIVIQAQEQDDVLMCAKFQHNGSPPTASRQTRIFWYKVTLDNQKVLLDQQLDSIRQLDSCLLLTQVSQLKHSGEYICETRAALLGLDNTTATVASSAPLERQSFKLLVQPGQLDVQIQLKSTPTSAAAAVPVFRPSSLFASQSQQLAQSMTASQDQMAPHMVHFGASLQLECSIKSALPPTNWRLQPRPPLIIDWFKDSRLLYRSRLIGDTLDNYTSTSFPALLAGRNSTSGAGGAQYSMSKAGNSNIRLLQPNVISIESSSPADRGYYQCFIYHQDLASHSDDTGGATDPLLVQELADMRRSRDKAQLDYLLDLKLTSSGTFASSASSPSSQSLRRLQLETSGEFRRELQVFQALSDHYKYQLSSSGASLQLDLILSKPQLVQRFSTSEQQFIGLHQLGGTLSLECAATGYPLPRISWFLDDFLIATTNSNDNESSFMASPAFGISGGGDSTSSSNYELLHGGDNSDSANVYQASAFGPLESGSAYHQWKRNELDVNSLLMPDPDDWQLADVTQSMRLAPQIDQPDRFTVASRVSYSEPPLANRGGGANGMQLVSVKSQLNVSNMDEMDLGHYKCLAWNSYGQAEHSASILVGGGSGPASQQQVQPSRRQQLQHPVLKLRTYEPKNITLIAGDNATLHCPVVGQPLARIFWFQAGKQLPKSHRQRVEPVQARGAPGGGGRLTIENVDPVEDSGSYTCRAQLADSSDKSEQEVGDEEALEKRGPIGEVHVSVLVPPLIDSQSLPEVVEANEGMRTKLVCSIKQGDLPVDIKWLRRVSGAQLPHNASTVKILNGRQLLGYELMQNTQEVRQAALRSDAAADDDDDQEVDNQEETRTSRGEPATTSGSTDLITIFNLEDSCQVTFRQISHLDSGDYLCLAQNRLSMTMRQVRVVVNVAPSWSLEPPDDVYVQLNQRLQLDCLAHGHPQPGATWRRSTTNSQLVSAASLLINGSGGGGSASSSSSRDQFVELLRSSNRVQVLANGTIVIDPIDLADSGAVLMCEQANGIGSGLSKLTRLHVQVAPFFAKQHLAKQVGSSSSGSRPQAPNQLVTGQLGGQAELKCVAHGDQPMIIGWRKGLDEVIDLVADERRKVVSRIPQQPASNVAGQSQQQQQLAAVPSLESSLNITNLTRKDTSLYSCIASNEFGIDELPVQLIVQEAPEEPELMRPIKSESRQATLSFQQPFDGNSPIRKYSIYYKQLTTASEGYSSESSAIAQQTRAEVNETSTNRMDSLVEDDWKQVVLDAPDYRQTPLQMSSAAGSVANNYQQQADGLVNLNLCCLKPFTRYAVRVAAINDIGPSKLARAPIRFQTEEEAIGGPPQDVSVEPTGAHSLKVRWREPTKQLQNGLIRGYYIGYRALVGPSGGSSATGAFATMSQTPLAGASNSVPLMMSSDSSEQYQYKNVQLDLVPSLGTSGAGLYQSSSSSSSEAQLDFDWTATMSGANMSSGQLQPPLDQAIGVGGKQQQQVYSTYLTNLRRKTAYSIIVQAYNKIGAGPRSDQIIVSTLDAAPPMSPDLELISTTYNSAQFSWSTRRFPSASAGPASASSAGTNQQQSVHQLLAPAELSLGDDDDPQAYYTISYKLDERYLGQQHQLAGAPNGPPAVAAASATMVNTSPPSEWQQRRVPNTGLGGAGGQSFASPLYGQDRQQRRVFTLNNLRCGSAYLAFMTATNSLGQSEPGETIKFNLRGGVPVAPSNSQDFLRVNSTYVTMKLSLWQNSGCTIGSFLIKYKPSTAPKWTVLEHQVHPTIQTVTLSGSSLFSSRPFQHQQRQAAPSDAGGELVAGTGQPVLLAADHYEAAQQANKQANLNDLVLRNLLADAQYKLTVEAISEAGSTLAEYEFETANLTSALVSIHVNGLVAQQQADEHQGVSGQTLSSGSGGAKFSSDHLGELEFRSLGAGAGIYQQKYGGNAGTGGVGGGAFWHSKQTLGVWSLTVVFVVASILMAITTLVLGFKSIVRMKQQQKQRRRSGRGLGGSAGDSTSSDGLVSTLFCCSSSSSSSESHSSSSESGSNSSASACYQITTGPNQSAGPAYLHHHHLLAATTRQQLDHERDHEHEHSFQELTGAQGGPTYCSLPANKGGVTAGYLNEGQQSNGFYSADRSHLVLADPSLAPGSDNGAGNQLDDYNGSTAGGLTTISGLLMRSSQACHDEGQQQTPTMTNGALDFYGAARGVGEFRSPQLVNSTSLSAIVAHGNQQQLYSRGPNPIGPNYLTSTPTRTNRHTLTLAPASRRFLSSLSPKYQHEQNGTANELQHYESATRGQHNGHHYAATLGRQQHQQQQPPPLFGSTFVNQQPLKQFDASALYGRILNSSQKQMQFDEQQQPHVANSYHNHEQSLHRLSNMSPSNASSYQLFSTNLLADQQHAASLAQTVGSTSASASITATATTTSGYGTPPSRAANNGSHSDKLQLRDEVEQSCQQQQHQASACFESSQSELFHQRQQQQQQQQLEQQYEQQQQTIMADCSPMNDNSIERQQHQLMAYGQPDSHALIGANKNKQQIQGHHHHQSSLDRGNPHPVGLENVAEGNQLVTSDAYGMIFGCDQG